MRAAILLAMALCTFLSAPATAQSGPETYALVHLFAGPKDTPVQARGMGGASAALPEPQSINPAFLPLAGRPLVSLRHGLFSCHDADQTTVRQTSFKLIVPASSQHRQAWLVDYHTTDSGPTASRAFAPLPARRRLSEDSLTLGFGRRLSQGWAVGGMFAWIPVEIAYRVQPAGPALLSVESKPLYGGRVGVAYTLAGATTLGLVYDHFKERSRLESPILGTAAGDYRTSDLYLGAAHRLPDRTWVAVQYEHGRFTGTGIAGDVINEWRFGVERVVGNMALRAGLMDGRWTAGLGWRCRAWQADYAYQSNPHAAQLEPAFGKVAAHFLELKRGL